MQELQSVETNSILDPSEPLTAREVQSFSLGFVAGQRAANFDKKLMKIKIAGVTTLLAVSLIANCVLLAMRFW